ncbi:N-acetylneuraminate synthase family protein [Aquiluna sp.]|nr:N-acetylneuraminate synthase family protein [Aquiluna sp.]
MKVSIGSLTLSGFDGNMFVLDLANNHFGDVDHALKTIQAISDAVMDLEQSVVLKVQLRDLDSYIHPEFKARTDLHYIKRFLETRLDVEEFRAIAQGAKEAGFQTMATVFDEKSCRTFEEIGFDFVKIASASAGDLGLVEAATNLGLPVVASTGGLSLGEIQQLYEALRKSKAEFALMHCVSVYPSPDEILQLNQIRSFRELFPAAHIGWSTHENPANLVPVGLALALGATLFERHVGLPTDRYPLNAYSSNPELVRGWIVAAIEASRMLGSVERLPVTESERTTLLSLKRGVFSKSKVLKTEQLNPEDVYMAFPLAEGGVEAGTLKFPLNLKSDLNENQPILASDLVLGPEKRHEIRDFVASIRTILAKSRVAVNSNAKLELSHHYGISRFREFGVAMFTCINRNYAKKILVMLPRQKHPMHYHDMKEETFQLLWGDVQITVNGEKHSLSAGDLVTVYPKEWHKFTSLNGCVIEEVSTHHSIGDSFYEDTEIASAEPSKRKTVIEVF